MADNTTLPGTGEVYASDDIGGVKHFRTKMEFGADGSATDVSLLAGMPIQQGYATYSGTAGANNTDLVSIDCLGYNFFSYQSTGTFSATVSIQMSNDNSTWVTYSGAYSILSSAFVVSGISATGQMGFGNCPFRYLRFRTTAYTSGTPGITVYLNNSATPGPFNVAAVTSIANTVPTSNTNLTYSVVTSLASSSRTTTQTGSDVQVATKGMHVLTNVTTAGTGSITVTIQGKDELSSTYFDLLATTAITANGLYRLLIYPGLTDVANSVLGNGVLTRMVRIVVTANNANAMTYSVSYQAVP